MPGHTREIRWNEASDKANRRLRKLMEFLAAGENEYQELLQLWALHTGLDLEVAKQLFDVDVPSAEQLEMVGDLKAAMVEVHNIFTTADLGAIRKMT